MSTLTIYRPLQSNLMTQKFGENKLNYAQFGLVAHNGFDLIAWSGEPVYHSGDFEGVMFTEVDRMGGIGVDVFSNKPMLMGKRVKLRYWHLKTVIGWDGRRVKPGDLIGLADTTGFSTGNHLHFGLKMVDENNKSLNTDNGYFGGIDPMLYYKNVFIVKALTDVKAQALTVIELAKKLIFDIRNFLKGRKSIK